MIKTGLWGLYFGNIIVSYRAGNEGFWPLVNRGFGSGGGHF